MDEENQSTMSEASTPALYEVVYTMARKFLASYPGDCDAANNTALFGQIFSILNKDDERWNSDKFLEHVQLCLQFRLDQITTADKYVKLLGLSPPDGRLCHQFHHKLYSSTCDQKKYKRVYSTMKEGGVFLLFPEPPYGHGYSGQKGLVYLIAAIDYAGQDEDVLPEVTSRLERIVEGIKEEARARKTLLREGKIRLTLQELLAESSEDLELVDDSLLNVCMSVGKLVKSLDGVLESLDKVLELLDGL